MINWTLVWLFFRLSFIIDWGGSASLVIDWLPTLTIVIGEKDETGHRLYQIGAHFLIFGIELSYYYPSLFIYDDQGNIEGKNLLPSCMVMEGE